MGNKAHFLLIRLGEKFSAVSIIMATLACASCFPALAGIGAALGMGIFSQWEGTILQIMIPGLAILILILQMLGWFDHKNFYRTLLGVVGPIGILLSFILFSIDQRAIYLFYVSLFFISVVSIFDLFIFIKNKSREKNSCCQTE